MWSILSPILLISWIEISKWHMKIKIEELKWNKIELEYQNKFKGLYIYFAFLLCDTDMLLFGSWHQSLRISYFVTMISIFDDYKLIESDIHVYHHKFKINGWIKVKKKKLKNCIVRVIKVWKLTLL